VDTPDIEAGELVLEAAFDAVHRDSREEPPGVVVELDLAADVAVGTLAADLALDRPGEPPDRAKPADFGPREWGTVGLAIGVEARSASRAADPDLLEMDRTAPCRSGF
jgi:hypothetical protein